MKKGVRILLVAVALVVILLGSLLVYFFSKYPDAGPAPNLTIAPTAARLERGRYLVNNVSVCLNCHSTRDWTKFSGPTIPGTDGKGGERLGEEFGLPGTLFASNITPSGIGKISDGGLMLAITSGIGKDHRALFPIMPYPNFTRMSDEDLYSIIAYIRTLKPVENSVPERTLNFPLNLIVRMIPKPHSPRNVPVRSDTVGYGEYLVTAASCSACHTRMKKGEPIPGMAFAGGNEFVLPQGTVRSANITPDDETGIGGWTKDLFVLKFKQFATPDSTTTSPESMGYNSVMPWTDYAGMTEDDLGAIFAYLRTLTPVHNLVEKFTPKAQ